MRTLFGKAPQKIDLSSKTKTADKIAEIKSCTNVKISDRTRTLVRKSRVCLDTAWNWLVAGLTEETCRFCDSQIDQLGKLENEHYVRRARFWLKDGSKTREFISEAICAACVLKLNIDEPIVTVLPIASSGNATDPDTLLVASGSDYSDPMRKLIRHLKYDKDKILARELAPIAWNSWSAFAELVPHDAVIVAVPLHWRRQFQRGYNQAELIAEELSKLIDVRVMYGALIRRKKTRPQNKLTKEQREQNLTAAFMGKRKLLQNQVVLLVDDVCTSGATLAECATELYRCGAQRVYALTVAKAILRHPRKRS